MKFSHHDVGMLKRGDIVRVSLSGNAANVRLLDSTNFQKYRAGKPHKSYGGLLKRSPLDFAIPHNGHWHVAVDMVGLRGTTRASVHVLPRPMRPIQPQSGSSIDALIPGVAARTASGATEERKEWDVFISHATEDKEQLVRPLARHLQALGLKVWYDEFELRIGDSLRRKIDAGLVRSRHGLVVLSPAFFGKNWPQYELDGLVTREMDGHPVILPIWHRLTKSEVIANSPPLADKFALGSSEYTIEEIADEVLRVVRP